MHCIRDLAELEALRPAWEALLARIPSASIFNTWEWLGPWWRNYGSDRELIVLACYDTQRELVGLAPLSRTLRRVAPGVRLRMLEFMGDGSEDSDNLDILAAPGWEAHVVDRLLHYFTREDPAWDAALLNLFPSYSPTAAALRSELGRGRWTFFESTHPWCVLHLPDTWEEYLQQVSRKEREKIQYYDRRLKRLHETRFYACRSELELSQYLRTLFELHQMRWTQRGEPGSFAWDARRAFYHDLSRELLARNQLEFWLLDINGKPAAAQYGFRYRETVYLLQQGFDTQYAQLSVQDVLHTHVFKQLITQGIRRYDFLGGVSIRKQRWGAKVGKYTHQHFARPFTRGSLYLQTVNRAGASKEWLRAKLPPAAWNAFRRAKQRMAGGNRRTEPADASAPEESTQQPAE